MKMLFSFSKKVSPLNLTNPKPIGLFDGESLDINYPQHYAQTITFYSIHFLIITFLKNSNISQSQKLSWLSWLIKLSSQHYFLA